jgi:hypothetical protein
MPLDTNRCEKAIQLLIKARGSSWGNTGSTPHFESGESPVSHESSKIPVQDAETPSHSGFHPPHLLYNRRGLTRNNSGVSASWDVGPGLRRPMSWPWRLVSWLIACLLGDVGPMIINCLTQTSVFVLSRQSGQNWEGLWPSNWPRRLLIFKPFYQVSLAKRP